MFLRVVTVLVLIFLVAGAGLAYYALRTRSTSVTASDLLSTTMGQPASSDPRPVHFVINPGESAATIGEHLQTDGLIRSGLAFRLLVRFQGLGGHLIAGDYELRPNMSLREVASVLTQGREVGGFVTMPEGWRALEVADALERAKVTSRSDFLRAIASRANAPPAIADQIPPTASLEGFLFPDSYRFDPGSPAGDVARQMTDDFAQHLSPDLQTGFQANGLSLYQAVTMASIVEREAAVPGERPVIASVFLNRLRRGMKLQADPTVQYALASADDAVAVPVTSSYWKRGLTFADLQVQSPYNTYVVAGLPPGPICSPGLASLQAVARPATSDFLYFVARGDGTHAFARTLDEQQRNVARYQSG
jgi:UPF0755 protein